MGTVMGAAVGRCRGRSAPSGRPAAWSAVRWSAALAGNLVGRALDDQERRAARRRRRSTPSSPETNVPTTYTVEPTPSPPVASSTAPPTVVSAKPVGAGDDSRADGSTCRPIELTATKNGQTTTETTTFCKSAGSQELKPVSV